MFWFLEALFDYQSIRRFDKLSMQSLTDL